MFLNNWVFGSYKKINNVIRFLIFLFWSFELILSAGDLNEGTGREPYILV